MKDRSQELNLIVEEVKNNLGNLVKSLSEKKSFDKSTQGAINGSASFTNSIIFYSN